MVVGAFGLGALRGAPFLPVLKGEVGALLDLAQLESGQCLMDLGSGDGRLLKAAARQGCRGIGYEINPWLYLYSLVNCWSYRRQIKLRLADFWKSDWSEADVIVVFLIKRQMIKLDRQLADLRRPVRVVSYIFEIPGRRPIAQNRNAFVYQYGSK